MRMMLKVRIPVERGNEAIKDGRLPRLLESMTAELKPEAAYFYAEAGMRTGIMVFNMQDTSQIPAIAEPFFLALNASVEFFPVMNAEDLLSKARPGFERAIDRYGAA